MHRCRLLNLCSAGVLVLLTACSTTLETRPIASPISSGSNSSASTAGTTVLDEMPGVAPLPAVVSLPSGEPDSALLLGGELTKEFQQGKASWYGPRFHTRRTASGERYDMHAFTAAHKTLPFGTMVRVRSLVNGKEVDVRITDRGPYSRGRVIDLSRAAAESLGMLGLGVKEVLLMVPESTSAQIVPETLAKPGRARRPR